MDSTHAAKEACSSDDGGIGLGNVEGRAGVIRRWSGGIRSTGHKEGTEAESESGRSAAVGQEFFSESSWRRAVEKKVRI